MPLTLFERVTKGLLCERWVGDWTKPQHIEPPALPAIAAPLSLVLLGCSTGGLGAQPLLKPDSHCPELQQLTPNSLSKLWSPTLWLPVAPWLYHCLTSTCFLWRHNSHSIQPVDSRDYPWYLRPNVPVIYTGAFLIWQLGQVGCQYVTNGVPSESVIFTACVSGQDRINEIGFYSLFRCSFLLPNKILVPLAAYRRANLTSC